MKKNILILLTLVFTTLIVGCSSNTSTIQNETTITYHLSKEELDEKLSVASIGVLTGGIDEIYTREDYPNATIYAYSANADILASLDSNKIDYGVLPEAQAKKSIQENNYKYEYCDTPIYSNTVSMALAKGNEDFISTLNDCLAKLVEDGTIESINTKWIVDANYTMEDVPVITDENAPVLKVAVDSGTEPYSFISNGELAGFDCEVIERVAYMLGMRVEFQEMAFASLIPSIVSGKSDLALGLVATEERKKEVDFTDPYFIGNLVAISKKENATNASFLDNFKKNFTGTFITENRWMLFVQGIGVTILISLFSFALATIVGALLCLLLISKNKRLNKLASLYSSIATGIPVLVWLMILYYIVFRSVDISGIIVAIITFGLQTGASLSGIFKTGIDSIDVGQREAALALGFDESKIFKKIIFPQAALNIFDLYVGEFVALVKTTSIVGYIAIADLTKVSDIVRSRTYQAFFPLIATALIYFVITYIFVIVLRMIQKKINPKLRKNILKGVQTHD